MIGRRLELGRRARPRRGAGLDLGLRATYEAAGIGPDPASHDRTPAGLGDLVPRRPQAWFALPSAAMEPTTQRPAVTFPIRIGRRSRWVLRCFGVGRDGATATIGETVDVRFGFFRLSTPVANVERWRIEGPFRWITAIGVRRSIFEGDVSFCGSADGAVRMDLRTRQTWGPLRVPAVWVGADDLEGFAAELAARGIPGEDVRGAPGHGDGRG